MKCGCSHKSVGHRHGGNACKIDPSERTATRHAHDHLDRLLNVLTSVVNSSKDPGRFGRKEIPGGYVLRLTAKATEKLYQNCVHIL